MGTKTEISEKPIKALRKTKYSSSFFELADKQRISSAKENKLNSEKSLFGWPTTIGLYVFSLSLFSKKREDKKSEASDKTINVDRYLYHTIGGCDPYKIISVLNEGIHSKKSAKTNGLLIPGFRCAEANLHFSFKLT